MASELYKLRECFAQKKIIFCYSGPLSQSLMVEIGSILKQRMEQESTGKGIISKTFAILIEQVQNIMHYSVEKTVFDTMENIKLSMGIVAVGFENNRYFVSSGNMIHCEDRDRIASMIEAINKMSPDEKKRYYKEVRKQPPDKKSRGAGLGFIEMARKTDLPVDFDFIDIDNNYCFFTIRLNI